MGKRKNEFEWYESLRFWNRIVTILFFLALIFTVHKCIT